MTFSNEVVLGRFFGVVVLVNLHQLYVFKGPGALLI